MSRIPAAILAFTLLGLPACATRPGPGYYHAETAKPYADVLAELELAITERNFRITGHNKIGGVIREREHIAFPDYDTIQFCNLSLARRMLELEPEAVSYMPCNVSVRSERGRVHITTHLLPTDSANPQMNEFARGMNRQLREIVDFAAEP
ncbi:DUF302 domain-containing protein [Methylomagnum ishizawai]|uniref:DUF302 domain-containing protein n=1 Tax=Methylomagnum ishizawai TaxID=1760988 RepID=UPI001C33DA4C|nr:DUF302 domain-containing protein [Methylomagnum ishizawai]BBL75276.1 hypothetical protein MishRS11D_23740 [Methylomagnum ishizawai]